MGDQLQPRSTSCVLGLSQMWGCCSAASSAFSGILPVSSVERLVVCHNFDLRIRGRVGEHTSSSRCVRPDAYAARCERERESSVRLNRRRTKTPCFPSRRLHVAPGFTSTSAGPGVALILSLFWVMSQQNTVAERQPTCKDVH